MIESHPFYTRDFDQTKPYSHYHPPLPWYCDAHNTSTLSCTALRTHTLPPLLFPQVLRDRFVTGDWDAAAVRSAARPPDGSDGEEGDSEEEGEGEVGINGAKWGEGGVCEEEGGTAERD